MATNKNESQYLQSIKYVLIVIAAFIALIACDSAVGNPNQARELFSRGFVAYKEKDYRLAAEMFRAGLEVEGTDYKAHFILAQIYLQLKDKRASASFRDVVRLAPPNSVEAIEARVEMERLTEESQKQAVREREESERENRKQRAKMTRTSDQNVLRQNGTSLEWTRTDNGGDLNWQEAKRYCSGLGKEWRLPSINELQSVIDDNAPGIECQGFFSRYRYARCAVSSEFGLGGLLYWSSEYNESGAILVYLWANIAGQTIQYAPDLAFKSRALCVRQF
jgi:hypothetical protein